MRNRIKKVILLAAAVALFLVLLSGCTNNYRFTSFSLRFDSLRARPYVVGETAEVEIFENGGKADAYIVFEKVPGGTETQTATLNKAQKIYVTFPKAGSHVLRVVPVVDGVQSKEESVTFTVVDDEFFIVNNVIEMEVGDTFNLRNSMQIYYPAGSGDYNLNIDDGHNTEYLEFANGVLTAKAARPEPCIVTFSIQKRPELKARLYIKITGDDVKSPFENFIVDCIGINTAAYYEKGDIALFQCIAYAGMREPDGYAAYRNNDGVLTAISASEFYKREFQGNTFYCVKINGVEQEHLRFYPVIDGEIVETVYRDVTLNLAFDVLPQAIEIENSDDDIVLLAGEEFTINAEVYPVDAADKTLEYAILSGDAVTLEDNVVTAKESIGEITTATVRVTASAKKNVHKDLVFKVLPIQAENVRINITGQTTQTIGNTSAVLMNVTGLTDYTHSLEWFVDGEKAYEGALFAYNWTDRITAGEIPGKVRISLEVDDQEITLERPFDLTLLSAVNVEGEIPEAILIGEKITFVPQTTISGAYFKVHIVNAETNAVTTFNNVLSGATFENIFEAQGSFHVDLELYSGDALVERQRLVAVDVILSYSHEIYNIWIDGYKSGSEYLPYIMWNYLGADVDYTVEFSRGTGEGKLTFSSTNPAHADYFTGRGFKFPNLSEYISYNYTLDAQPWNVRVRTSLGNRFTNYVLWDDSASLTPQIKSYFEELEGNGAFVGNRYISNIMELGELLSYLLILRPAEYSTGSNSYSILLYFSFEYDALDSEIKELYSRNGPITANTSDPTLANATKLIKAALDAYVGYAVSIGTSLESPGVKVNFTVSERTVEGPSAGDGKTYVLPANQYASSTPRGESNTDFPINSRPNSVSVSSGEQLLAAVELGFKPLPAAGSDAERLYNKAKEVLNGIIGEEMTDAEKVRAIYHYLCANVVYDTALAEDYKTRMQNATTGEQQQEIRDDVLKNTCFYLEGVFDHKLAVCDGISKAFALLCGMEDIPVIIVAGDANAPGATGDHAWNMVFLNKQWYYVDATWGRRENTVLGKVHVSVTENYLAVGVGEFDAQHIHVGEIPVAATDDFDFSAPQNSYMDIFFYHEEIPLAA